MDELEKAYREGYSHGFQTGIQTQTENFDSMIEKIRKWRADVDTCKGAPGSRFEEVDMNGFADFKYSR